MKKLNGIVWGIVLVAAGVLLGLNAFGITDIDIFFDGWWTLFIIVPCAVGLITDRDKFGSLIGICVGVFLLLCCRDVLDFSMVWKLLVPIIVVLIGLKLIIGGIVGERSSEVFKRIRESGGTPKNGTAVFSGSDIGFSGEVFEGARLTAVFGGVDCDLRGAVIEKDCVIDAAAVFGGITVTVPEGLNVIIRPTTMFGGVSDDRANKVSSGGPTLYINATGIFGGVGIDAVLLPVHKAFQFIGMKNIGKTFMANDVIKNPTHAEDFARFEATLKENFAAL